MITKLSKLIRHLISLFLIFLKKWLTKRRVWVTLAFCWPIILAAPYHIVKWSTQQSIHQEMDQLPSKSVGLVLGTSKYRVGGGINLFYKYRIEAITKLYHQGKIQHVLVSGDNSTHRYNEPSTILKDLISKGIPRDAITLDYAGFRTWDSILRAHQIFGMRDYIIVTQDFHLQRAIYIAQAHHQKVHGYEARTPGGATEAKMIIREHLARILMLWDIATENSPKFLGKKEPILIK